MRSRATATKEFPVHVCELDLTQGEKTVEIKGKTLHLPPAQPNHLVWIGDTGCRIGATESQKCDDPVAWPFAEIAKTSAETKPELVLHAGDYVYREHACPSGASGCTSSPHGDNWATWNTEFFTPAKPLLEAAPWIFVRGNHETCDRAGEGWFRLLDPSPYVGCKDYSPPYAVNLGSTRTVVMDTAKSKDFRASEKNVRPYQSQFLEIEKRFTPFDWLLTHHPIWGLPRDSMWTPGISDTLQQAISALHPQRAQQTARFHVVLSGHVHSFEALSFQDDGPSQLVVGSSGTETGSIPETADHAEPGDRKVKFYKMHLDPGFMTLDRSTSTLWNLSIRDSKGQSKAILSLEGSHLK